MSSPRIVDPLEPPTRVRPCETPADAPDSSISGDPAYPGCVEPSIVTGAVKAGSGEPGAIVCTPAPAMLKPIEVPELASANPIAARSVQTPFPVAVSHTPGVPSQAPSPVELTTTTVPAAAESATPTVTHATA